MTVNSYAGAYLSGMTERLGYASQFVDTGAVLWGVVNNLQHLVDQSTKHVANIVFPAGELVEQTEPSFTEFKRFDKLPPIVFPITCVSGAAGGRTAKLVTRLHASISQAGTATYRVRVQLFPSWSAAPYLGSSNLAEVSTTSTTGQDLTATLEIDADSIARVLSGLERHPLGAIYGTGFTPYKSLDHNGNPATARVLMGQLDIWAMSSGTQQNPRLHAVMVREYA